MPEVCVAPAAEMPAVAVRAALPVVDASPLALMPRVMPGTLPTVCELPVAAMAAALETAALPEVVAEPADAKL